MGAWSAAVVLLFMTLPVSAQLDESCIATIQNRSVRVNPDGSFLVTDIPADPGNFRARVSCANGEVGESPLFQFIANDHTHVGDIALGSVSPIPLALEIRPGTSTLTSKGQRTLLSVVGFLADGSERSFSDPTLGTEFWSSEPRVGKLVTVTTSEGPRVALEAVERGRVLVAARYEGVLGAIEIELPLPNDADNDGLTDEFEEIKGLDPNDPSDAFLDPDGDNLTNLEEFLLGTEIFIPDTDADGLDDGREVELGTDPLRPDTDGDRLLDGLEIGRGTNPLWPIPTATSCSTAWRWPSGSTRWYLTRRPA